MVVERNTVRGLPVEQVQAGSSPVDYPRRTMQDGGTEWLCEYCAADVLFETHADGCPRGRLPKRGIRFERP